MKIDIEQLVKDHLDQDTREILKNVVRRDVAIDSINNETKTRITDMFFGIANSLPNTHYNRWGNLAQEFKYAIDKIADYSKRDYDVSNMSLFCHYLLNDD